MSTSGSTQGSSGRLAVSRFSEGVSWSTIDVTLIMFAAFPAGRVVSLQAPPGAQLPDRIKVFPLMDEQDLLPGREVVEYDVVFLEMPRDPEGVVSAWLEVSLEAGAEFSWFAYEGSFSYDEVLTESIATCVYGVAAAGVMATALDDELRDGDRWREQVVSLRRRLGLG